MHGGCEVVEDAAPVAFVVGAAAVAFVNDDEVEEVRLVLAEVRARPPLVHLPVRAQLRRQGEAGHERLEDREEDLPVLRDLSPLFNGVGLDADEVVFVERRERGEFTEA